MAETEPAPAAGPPPNLPEPAVRRLRPSLIWLVPLVAALIGAWLSLKSYTEKGATITITFQSAEGLEAGQTRIKHKDVEVGRVTAINLSPDFSRVVVTAELTRSANALHSEYSRFWVVRARIGTTGITGLGTLLSGAYIGMDPGPPGRKLRDFRGLESAPTPSLEPPGEYLDLQAEKVGSLNVGSPVTYRQFHVGEVAALDLDPKGQSVVIRILVREPYRGLIRRDTRFWDAGGVDVGLDASGLKLHADSMAQLLLGGIAFENPTNPEQLEMPAVGQPFTLYSSREKAYERVYHDRRFFVLQFDESIRGLVRGAPVEFKGIKVGQVEDFKLVFQPRLLEGRIPVLIALEPERMGLKPGHSESMDEVVARLVHKGFRARLRTSSLLTGSLYVDLGFYPQAAPRNLVRDGGYPEIPTLPSTVGAMTESLTALAERLQKLPLEDIAQELRSTFPALRDTLAQVRGLLSRLDTETAPQVKATLAQAQATLATLERTLGSGSASQSDLHEALDEFAQAARALQNLADTLERHPESLVFGKGKRP